ncbi:MAG: methionyl-tRNA formyltransferase [Planctomycetota bacterium]
MRIVFLGTPEFAVHALRALAASEHEVALVVTQPDRPAGRGKKLLPPPVKSAAADLGLPVFQPEKINTRAARERVRAARPDVAVVVAYGQILRPLFLGLPAEGCLNVHASILPRWRGASPINAQILAGDDEVGVSVMKMDEGLDTGPVGLVVREPARPRETAGELHDRLAPLGGAAIVRALDALARGELRFEPQDDASATRAGLLAKEDGRLDWRSPAAELDRRVRGLSPWPGAWAELGSGGETTVVQLLRAEIEAGTGEPGTLLEARGDRLVVAAGAGSLALTEIKAAGRRPMSVRDFLNGARLAPDARFLVRSLDS